MQKIVSTTQMREIDRVAIEEYGIPETILMENAGLESIKFLEEYGSLEGKRIGVFCGKGNNGGDGFVIARHLHLRGVDVALYLLAKQESLKGDAKLNMDIYLAIGGRMKVLLSDTDIKKHKIAIKHADLLVDAIIGTGINGELKGIYKTVVEKINEWKRFCLAIDIPTGLCSDKGAIYPLHVNADATIAFGHAKTGTMFHPAVESVGVQKAVNISFPTKVLDESPCDAFVVESSDVKTDLGVPTASAHKGNFGHAVIAGGSAGMGGAVYLASLSALKVGAGLSTAVVDKNLSSSFEIGSPEVMSFSLDGYGDAEKLLDFVKDKSSLLIGPGMGRAVEIKSFIRKLISSADVQIILDADGLNNIASNPSILQDAKSPVIITPHPGEMSRLSGLSTEQINGNRLKTAKKFSASYNCITVLKGARTVIATPAGTAFINVTGNSNLATGGSGDVLAGMIAGFIARGFEPVKASYLAVYIHGLASDIYTRESDCFSLTASKLIEFIPVAFSEISL